MQFTKGMYTPFNADGEQDQFPVAIKGIFLHEITLVLLNSVIQEVLIQTKLEGCLYICKCYDCFLRDSAVFMYCVVEASCLHGNR